MSESPRTPIDPAGVATAGVWRIPAPVAGHFPTSAYYYRLRQGTALPNIPGGNTPGEPGSDRNNFAQTITWEPAVSHAFLPNTQYTATIKLSPVHPSRTFAMFPLGDVPSLAGLPQNAAAITCAHAGHDLLIHIAFEPTGDTIQTAQRIMYEDWATAGGYNLGKYFRHASNDPVRHGLCTWRDDMSFVRPSQTPGIGNELVVSFKKDPSLAPSDVPQVFKDNWIRSGGVTTRERSPGTEGINGNTGVDRGDTAVFENAYGYYEGRIQFDSIRGMWGAFWLMGFQVDYFADHPHSHGAMGTEIDIVETFHSWRTEGPLAPHGFNSALHWDGYGPEHDGTSMDYTSDMVGTNVYDGSFHTFAVEWSPQEYVFYLDGKEIGRNRDGDTVGLHGMMHVTPNPTYVKLSIEAAAWAGGQGDDNPIVVKDAGEFRVDYVSVWNGPRPSIVSYHAGGGQGAMEDSLVVRGTACTLQANAFTRPGYRFAGWNTSPDGTGANYAAGDVITTSANIADIALHAQWVQA